ncbi:hypothetical protein D3877_27380 [Azospirillum cavernae]|uniref:Uncharacterized protein n=1 Tax=Azospirillum cavernae TaxID=2320860 RepID=A0A418VMU2_9PROT|nr:hypothetical protein [Azospirillum cavernae]RJF77500.1 hypothetical protein D3877_27380 [Azospirillum cavernae]
MNAVFSSIPAFLLLSIISLLAYRRARRSPKKVRSVLLYGFFANNIAAYMIYCWISHDLHYLMDAPNDPIRIFGIILFVIGLTLRMFDSINDVTRSLGVEFVGAQAFSLVFLFAVSILVPTLALWILKSVHRQLMKKAQPSVRNSLDLIQKSLKKILEILFGQKTRLLLRPNRVFLIQVMEGGLCGLWGLFAVMFLEIAIDSEHPIEMAMFEFIILTGPWVFLIEFVALFAPDRARSRREALLVTAAFPAPQLCGRTSADLAALHRACQTAKGPRLVWSRGPDPSGRRFSNRLRPVPRLSHAKHDRLVSEPMSRPLAIAILRHLKEQVALGRTILLIAPEAWIGSLEPLIGRFTRNSETPTHLAVRGLCTGQGMPRLLIAGFDTLGALAERWPTQPNGKAVPVDLLVAVGLEQASGQLRTAMTMLCCAIGAGPSTVLAQAEHRRQSEAAVRDLLLLTDRLEEITLHAPTERRPDHLLLWEDDPEEGDIDAGNGMEGPRPDTALRLAAMAWAKGIPCALAPVPDAHDVDALERCLQTRSGGRHAERLRFPGTDLEERDAPVRITWDHGNLADALNRSPARRRDRPWMLHVLMSRYSLAAEMIAALRSGNALTAWEPLAPHPLGSVVEWTLALRRVMARPQGLTLEELDTAFSWRLPPGMLAGFDPPHALGPLAAIIEQVDGPSAGLRLWLGKDGRPRLSASPPTDRGRLAVATLEGALARTSPVDIGDHGLTFTVGTMLRFDGKNYRIGAVQATRLIVHHDEASHPAARCSFQFERHYRLVGPQVLRESSSLDGGPKALRSRQHLHSTISRTTIGYVERSIAGRRPERMVILAQPIEIQRRFVSIGWFRLKRPADCSREAMLRILRAAQDVLRLLFPALHARCAVVINKLSESATHDIDGSAYLVNDGGVIDECDAWLDLLVIEDSEQDLGVVRALIWNPCQFIGETALGSAQE